jgi:hypothetical protein
MSNLNILIMKKLTKMSWALIIAVLMTANVLVSCKKDDNSSNNGNANDPNTIASSNLIAYFPFDNEPTAGSAVANSNNTITFSRKVGNVTFPAGRKGNAYMGSSTESYLEYNIAPGSQLSTLDEFTIACWIKTPVTTTGAAKIFSINGGDPFMGNLALIQESQATGDSVDMKVYLFDSASPDWKGQDIRKNKKEFLNDKWFHFMAVYRKATSELILYANGKPAISQIKYAGPVPGTGPQPLLEGITLGSDMNKIYFGAWPQQIAGTPETWMTYFKGMVDEFRLYNKALTDTEIMNLYQAEVSQINQ